MWTLHVEDFAGIESADIEVSPLTLFVGDNNSGKSYLLSLIYGLTCADDVLSDLCEDSPEYRACSVWIKQVIEQAKGNGNAEQPFDDYAYAIFENLFNRILQDNQKAILQSIFKKDISAGKISVTFSRRKEETLCISIDKRNSLSVKLSFSIYAQVFDSHVTLEQQIKNAVWVVLESIVRRFFTRWGPLEKIAVLPTARTGFLLTYPALAKDAFSQYRRPNSSLPLTRLCTDFLGNLAALGYEGFSVNLNYTPIVKFIERNIIHGQIIVSNNLPLPEFYYKPTNMEISLPMYLSSDVIKEMTPLILALQYQGMQSLFIEEPEMNLHPKLQQMMARTLIKIVNAGTPVLAATHSDTILQHVNNMVKLGNLPEARRQTLIKRFEFDQDDPISADKISMYQFDVQDNGRTIVRRLSCGDYGFEVPTFYDPLEKLLEQTRATEPDAEEYED